MHTHTHVLKHTHACLSMSHIHITNFNFAFLDQSFRSVLKLFKIENFIILLMNSLFKKKNLLSLLRMNFASFENLINKITIVTNSIKLPLFFTVFSYKTNKEIFSKNYLSNGKEIPPKQLEKAVKKQQTPKHTHLLVCTQDTPSHLNN